MNILVMMEQLRDLILGVAPKVILSLILFLAFWIAGIVVQKILVRISTGNQISPEFLKLMGKTLKIVIILVGAITAMGTLGINVTALVAGLGLGGFALGFALKDVLSNLLAGVLILFYQPFRTNDRISVGGIEGRVTEIDLRYTTIRSNDKKVLVPNATLFKKEIVILSEDENSSTD